MSDEQEWYPKNPLKYPTATDVINAYKEQNPNYDHENDPDWEPPEELEYDADAEHKSVIVSADGSVYEHRPGEDSGLWKCIIWEYKPETDEYDRIAIPHKARSIDDYIDAERILGGDAGDD